nr:probable gluconokinase isoform X3 [Anolis sagrei ordinatus]
MPFDPTSLARARCYGRMGAVVPQSVPPPNPETTNPRLPWHCIERSAEVSIGIPRPWELSQAWFPHLKQGGPWPLFGSFSQSKRTVLPSEFRAEREAHGRRSSSSTERASGPRGGASPPGGHGSQRVREIYCGLTSGRQGWKFYEGDDYHPDENKKKMAEGIPLNDQDPMALLPS